MKISLRTSLLTLPLVLALTGCATPIQLMAYREVDRLCEKEGGIFIYEQVTLSPSEFYVYPEGHPKHYLNGKIKLAGGGDVPDKHSLEPRFKINTSLVDTLSPGGHTLIQREATEVWRARDNRILGRAIDFSYSSGEPTTPFYRVHHCKVFDMFPIDDLLAKIFTPGALH